MSFGIKDRGSFPIGLGEVDRERTKKDARITRNKCALGIIASMYINI